MNHLVYKLICLSRNTLTRYSGFVLMQITRLYQCHYTLCNHDQPSDSAFTYTVIPNVMHRPWKWFQLISCSGAYRFFIWGKKSSSALLGYGEIRLERAPWQNSSSYTNCLISTDQQHKTWWHQFTITVHFSITKLNQPVLRDIWSDCPIRWALVNRLPDKFYREVNWRSVFSKKTLQHMQQRTGINN